MDAGSSPHRGAPSSPAGAHRSGAGHAGSPRAGEGPAAGWVDSFGGAISDILVLLRDELLGAASFANLVTITHAAEHTLGLRTAQLRKAFADRPHLAAEPAALTSAADNGEQKSALSVVVVGRGNRLKW